MKQLGIFITTTLVLGVLLASPAHAIKKCKDADGKWHYGDVAVSACKTSKVTTLNDRGFITAEKSAPKTEEELAAEKKAQMSIEAEEKRLEAEQNERNRILSVYETESDIDRQRDNQLNSVDSNIAVHKSYLKAMNAKVIRLQEQLDGAKKWKKDKLLADIDESKVRIEDSSAELQKLIDQKTQIMEKFATEKETYRTLKAKS